MSANVDIIAVGARTPLGFGAEASAAAARAGIVGYVEFPFVSPSGVPVVVAADADLDFELEGRARLVPLIASVIEEVTGKLCEFAPYTGTYHLFLALPEARPGFSKEDGDWVVDAVSSELGSFDEKFRVAVAGRGHAGAIRATQRAIGEVAKNPGEVYLVVGADTYHQPDTLMWLEQNKQLKEAEIRSGFIPGEGVGCLAISGPGLHRKLRLPRLASIRGIGMARETLLRDSETGSFGVGMSEAVKGAVAHLKVPAEGVDTLYTDINGERYRSEEWGFVAMRTPLVWKSLDYESPAECWGDVGAASAALAGVLATQSFARGYARGPRALVMAGSTSGLRGAMLIEGEVA